MTTDDVRTEECPMCEASGIHELDSFYMVGPSAREETCPGCSGHAYVSPWRKADLERAERKARR